MHPYPEIAGVLFGIELFPAGVSGEVVEIKNVPGTDGSDISFHQVTTFIDEALGRIFKDVGAIFQGHEKGIDQKGH